MIDLEIEISIIDDLNQGHPHRTIAKRYNVSRGVVLRVAAQGGKLRKREGDVKMPEFKKVAPYCCDGDDGDLHGPWWTDTRPCRRCWVERWMRAHV